jgi:hypothetical protein
MASSFAQQANTDQSSSESEDKENQESTENK